jgi:hypothetical protein
MKSRGRHLNRYRKKHPTFGKSEADALYGYFVIPCNGVYLHVISSGSHAIRRSEIEQWEHVSVSLPDRCPTWEEMCHVKSMFWSDSETVIQFHPRKTNYVNIHEHCLHLWKRVGVEAELPPTACV